MKATDIPRTWMWGLLAAIGAGSVCPPTLCGHEILWKYQTPSGCVDPSPAVGDIDGDGAPDLVLASTSGSVIALGRNGLEKWRWDVRQQVSIPPTLADITGDPIPEILVLSNVGRLSCLDGRSGNPLWTYDLPGRVDWGVTSVVAVDVNRDGKLEILAADSAATMVCLNGQGAPLWTLNESGGWRSSPAVGDLNADGFCEILIASGQSPLVCVSHEGKVLWRLAQQGGAGASPVIWDLDGDGKPEIVTGIGAKLTAVRADGKVLWQHPMSRDIDAAISVADADGDGMVEIYAVDLNGQFVCVDRTGTPHWKAGVEQRVRRSPAVADVDGDGRVEIVVGGYSGTLYLFDTNGEHKERIPLCGTMNATPTVVDLAGDGKVQIICPLSDGSVVAFQWKFGKAPATVLWPEYRYNSRRTAAPTPDATTPQVTLAKADYGQCHVGTNTFAVRVNNPARKTLNVLLSVSGEEGILSSARVTSADQTVASRLSYTITGMRAATLRFGCEIREGDTVLLRRTHEIYVAPFVRELAELDEMLGRLVTLVPRLPDRKGLEERVQFIRGTLPGYRDRVQIATALPPLERSKLGDELAEARKEAARMFAIAQRAALTGPPGGAFASAANPWAPFGGIDEVVEDRLTQPELWVQAFGGETESAALNIFNPAGRPMAFRLELTELTQSKDKPSVRAREVIELREAVDIPTLRMDWSADALPLLNQGQTILVPAWGARQLWFTINTARLAPGAWTGRIRLRALNTSPHEIAVPLTIEVWKAGLPAKQPLRLCHWGYVHQSVLSDQPEAAMKDQLAHGTNVFVGGFVPIVKFNADGALVGEIDYKAHDNYVRRHAPHGIVLFQGWGIGGPAEAFTPAWKKAAIAYIRAWVKHLAEMGVGYDGFAFYPVDEPGLNDGLVDLYVNYAKVAREADPKILMYTDPVGRASMDDLKKMAPYVDIWCPNRRGYLMGAGDEKLAFIKSTGKTVWTYECEGDAKHQSPLAYYRGLAWLAWRHGLTGIGFWNYCVGPEPWYEKGEYTMIYQGDGVVPSKRWEAVRDGIEDYSMLVELKKAADAAEAAGRVPEAVKSAKTLLNEDAAAIAAFCGSEDEGTLPGPDGPRGDRVVADRRWKAIQVARRKMATLLDQLAPATR